jgi:uncharacterized protein YutE (UPF0331/DUF86 family)
MTFLVERLTELRRHLDHLRDLRPRVTGVDSLVRDLSLHNDVLFSLLMVSQHVIDIAGELGASRGLRFDDYTEAVRNLSAFREFPPKLVSQLERLPDFRNVVIHDYVGIDLERAVSALDELDPLDDFVSIVAALIQADDHSRSAAGAEG